MPIIHLLALSSRAVRTWLGLQASKARGVDRAKPQEQPKEQWGPGTGWTQLKNWGTIQKTQERRQKPEPEWRVWSGDQAAWTVWLSWQNWEELSETVCSGRVGGGEGRVDKMKPSRGFQAKLGQATFEDEELSKWTADFYLGGICISNWPAVSTIPDSVYFSKSMPSVLLKVRQCDVCSLNTNY